MVAGEELQGAERRQRRDGLLDEREGEMSRNLDVVEGEPVGLVDEVARRIVVALHVANPWGPDRAQACVQSGGPARLSTCQQRIQMDRARWQRRSPRP
jgi:hypothetical protein